jgi:hypothetical protein
MSLLNRYFLVLMTTILCLWGLSVGGGALEAGEGIRVFQIDIEQREVTSDLKIIVVNQGQWVKLVWLSDEDVDIHLHGYDIQLGISAHVPEEMLFRAHATGRFSVTSHGFGEYQRKGGAYHHGALIYLEVHPN